MPLPANIQNILNNISANASGFLIANVNNPILQNEAPSLLNPAFLAAHFLCRTPHEIAPNQTGGLLICGINPNFDPGQANVMVNITIAQALTLPFNYEGHRHFGGILRRLRANQFRHTFTTHNSIYPFVNPPNNLVTFIDLCPVSTKKASTIRLMMPAIQPDVTLLLNAYLQYYQPRMILCHGSLPFELIGNILPAPAIPPVAVPGIPCLSYNFNGCTVMATSYFIPGIERMRLRFQVLNWIYQNFH